MARRADTEFAVRTTGLGALNRSLGRISKDLRKESVGELREIAKRVRGKAQQNAESRRRSGAQVRSYRYSASNRGAAISAANPQSGVLEYGGTIQPRGVPIAIRGDRAVGRAIQSDAARIEEEVGDLLDRIARRNGFR